MSAHREAAFTGPKPGVDSMMEAQQGSSSSLAKQPSIAFSQLPMSSCKAVIAVMGTLAWVPTSDCRLRRMASRLLSLC